MHELVDLGGEEGYLANPFIHYNYATISQFLAKQRVYCAMEADDLFSRGLRARPHNFLLQPWRQFWRRYVTLCGYKDGRLGLMLSLLLAYYEFKTYVRLASLGRSRAKGSLAP